VLHLVATLESMPPNPDDYYGVYAARNKEIGLYTYFKLDYRPEGVPYKYVATVLTPGEQQEVVDELNKAAAFFEASNAVASTDQA